MAHFKVEWRWWFWRDCNFI